MKQKLTQKMVRAELALVGIRIRKTDAGDFRVAHSLTEQGGYYTTDLQDALDTGKAMAKERDRKATFKAGQQVEVLRQDWNGRAQKPARVAGEVRHVEEKNKRALVAINGKAEWVPFGQIDAVTMSKPVAKQATDQRETFAQYLARVGRDHKESGTVETAKDYAQASARIEELELALGTLEVAALAYALEEKPDARRVLNETRAVLVNKFQHLEG